MYELYWIKNATKGDQFVKFVPTTPGHAVVSIALSDFSAKPSEKNQTDLVVSNAAGRKDVLRCSGRPERDSILLKLIELVTSGGLPLTLPTPPEPVAVAVAAAASSSSCCSEVGVDKLAESLAGLQVRDHADIMPVLRDEENAEAALSVTAFCRDLYKNMSGKIFCRTDTRHSQTIYSKWIKVDNDKHERNNSVHDFGARIAAIVSTIARALPSLTEEGLTVSHEFSVSGQLPLGDKKVALSGRIDYLGVCNKTNRLVVIDYKSASSSKFVNAKYLVVPDIVQLRVYALLVRHAFRLDYTPDCYILKFSVTSEIPHNSKHSKRLLGLWKLSNTEGIDTLDQAIDVPLVTQQ